MAVHPDHPRRWQRGVQRIAAIRPVTRFFSLCLPFLDRQLIHWSAGRTSLTRLMTGFPIVTLRTLGARSGIPRENPLVGIPFDHGRYILIASNWGQERHPAWYHNLRAHPRVQLIRAGIAEEYVAHEAEGEERSACWRRAVEVYAGYEAYRHRAGERRIPVIVLTPSIPSLPRNA
ncbi:MAG: nitroreductase/quinone reductase family protein [Blastocatellia bacterium]|jgi:deazaflavin-dependent oxidoreductase (nitroreductase family)